MMQTTKGTRKTKYAITIMKEVGNVNKNVAIQGTKAHTHKCTSGHDRSMAVKHGQSDESGDPSEHCHLKER